ncbi:MAG: hypothetical protein KDA89_19385 [Planctomycetaceae bacterium]|nr:hypothetical protein [Planctomycetaceae bacterium]
MSSERDEDEIPLSIDSLIIEGVNDDVRCSDAEPSDADVFDSVLNQAESVRTPSSGRSDLPNRQRRRQQQSNRSATQRRRSTADDGEAAARASSVTGQRKRRQHRKPSSGRKSAGNGARQHRSSGNVAGQPAFQEETLLHANARDPDLSPAKATTPSSRSFGANEPVAGSGGSRVLAGGVSAGTASRAGTFLRAAEMPGVGSITSARVTGKIVAAIAVLVVVGGVIAYFTTQQSTAETKGLAGQVAVDGTRQSPAFIELGLPESPMEPVHSAKITEGRFRFDGILPGRYVVWIKDNVGTVVPCRPQSSASAVDDRLTEGERDLLLLDLTESSPGDVQLRLEADREHWLARQHP